MYKNKPTWRRKTNIPETVQVKYVLTLLQWTLIMKVINHFDLDLCLYGESCLKYPFQPYIYKMQKGTDELSVHKLRDMVDKWSADKQSSILMSNREEGRTIMASHKEMVNSNWNVLITNVHNQLTSIESDIYIYI